MITKNNAIPLTENDTMPQAKKALRMIWSTGIVCLMAGFLFFLNLFNSQIREENQTGIIQNQEGKSIDQLLLSSDESLLSDNKSFVNVALRFQGNNQEKPDLNQGDDRNILYDNILKKKLQRIPRAKVSDFSIKPILQ